MLREHAVAAGYVGAWRLVRLLPERHARRLFDAAALRVHQRDGSGVRRLRRNLRAVRPDLDDAGLDSLTEQGVRSYFRYWCESFRLPAWPLDDLVRRTRTVREHLLRDPLAAGRGAVVALPHQGNWDWAGAWACATGMPVMTVAERLRPERLYDEFVAYRASLGMQILPLTGAGSPMPALADHLRGNGFVPLLADRDLSRGGVDVTLCGAPARMPQGPALLAQQTGAALVPISLAYRGDDMEITFYDEVDVGEGPDGVRKGMQQVADAFTQGLRADPQDWHMMQRVFLEEDAS